MKNIDKIEFRNYNRYEFVYSPNSSFIVIKWNYSKYNLNEMSTLLKQELKEDYLNQSGVYFLRLEDGYYIGETKDLSTRLKDHVNNKEVIAITVATYKGELDKLDKEQIRDLESILIDYAGSYGLELGKKLKNVKKENRKTSNILTSRENENYANYIWNQITFLNLKDILDEAQSKNLIAEKEKTNVSKTPVNLRVKLDKTLINFVDVKNHKINDSNEIFNHVPLRLTPTQGYRYEKLEIWNKDVAKKALFLYLYEGLSNAFIDEKLSKGARDQGFITTVTSAYLRIETNGNARNSLKDHYTEEAAKKLLEDYIDENY